MYNPADWYWMVGGDASRLWSSKAAAYVGIGDEGFLALFATDNCFTRIANEVLLADVLLKQYPEGAPTRPFKVSEIVETLATIDPMRLAGGFDAETLAAPEKIAPDDERLVQLLKACNFSVGTLVAG